MQRKILILRSKEKAKTLKEFLQQKNCEVFTLAPQKIIFQSLEKIIPEVDQKLFDSIILTSSNAAWALEKLCLDKNKKIFAVGKKTAEIINSLGFRNCEFPKIPSAQNLAFLIKDYYRNRGSNSLPQKNLLYLRGKKISFELQSELNSKEIMVHEIVVYKQSLNPNFTAQISSILKEAKIDEILVFSNQSLQILADSLDKNFTSNSLSDLEIVCFSEKIAANAAKHGFKNITTFLQKPFLKKFYELNNTSS